MQAAKVPMKIPNRPHIRRVSQRELDETRNSHEWDTSYGSSATANRTANRSHYPITPVRSNSWRPTEPPPRNPPNNDDDKKCWITRGWMICFGGIFCLILVVAVVAIVLGIVLPMTTVSPDSTATKKMVLPNAPFSTSSICSHNDLGLIANLNDTNPSQWIPYSYSYTATTITPIVFFDFEANLAHVFILDQVSIKDMNVPSYELLSNPSFENSTINPTDWDEPCNPTCTREIVSGSQCSGASGNCLKVVCPNGNPSNFFLSQSFQTIVGKTYTISFMFNHQANPTNGRNSLYLNVV